MKLLQSTWVLAVLALFVNFTMAAAMMLSFLGTVQPLHQVDEEVIEGTYAHFNMFSQEINELIDELGERDLVLEQRETELAHLEERLKAEREELERLRLDMQNVRDQLSTVIVEVKASEVKNVKELASIYESMPTKEVVTIFTQLEDDFVVKILRQMPSDTIGAIFKEMTVWPEDTEVMTARVAKMTEMMRMMVNKPAGTGGS